MIRVSRLTDYAVLILTHIAKEDLKFQNGPIRVLNARDLSLRTHLPLPTVGKILKELSHSKILLSVRGVRGGYRLARPARDLSISDIVSAMEGPIAVTDCAHGVAQCALQETCGTKTHWRMINDVVVKALKSVSLLDLSGGLPIPPPARSVEWPQTTLS